MPVDPAMAEAVDAVLAVPAAGVSAAVPGPEPVAPVPCWLPAVSCAAVRLCRIACKIAAIEAWPFAVAAAFWFRGGPAGGPPGPPGPRVPSLSPSVSRAEAVPVAELSEAVSDAVAGGCSGAGGRKEKLCDRADIDIVRTFRGTIPCQFCTQGVDKRFRSDGRRGIPVPAGTQARGWALS
jgi:hypothetical protein